MLRYKTIDNLVDEDNGLYKMNPIYPDIAFSEDDFWVITTLGDRWDTLASQFYKDSTAWWIIATANVSVRDTLSIPPGTQIRIPGNYIQAKDAYVSLNRNR